MNKHAKFAKSATFNSGGWVAHPQPVKRGSLFTGLIYFALTTLLPIALIGAAIWFYFGGF